jgi:hypothetical protein
VLAGCTQGAHLPVSGKQGTKRPAVPKASPTPHTPLIDHLAIIVMENKSYDEVVGSPEMPYLNSLFRLHTLLTNYTAVAHPSLPNYLALAGGSTFGIQSDCGNCVVDAPSLADQLDGRRLSWKAYMEDMQAPCQVENGALYEVTHNPFIYFKDLRRDRPRCEKHVVPFSQLSLDLQGTTPSFVWITPDVCNDTHDCDLATGDRWLEEVVPPILDSPAFSRNSLLVITFDEGATDEGGGGQVATLLISPELAANTEVDVPLNHYGLLATIEDLFRMPRLGQAASATSIASQFKP